MYKSILRLWGELFRSKYTKWGRSCLNRRPLCTQKLIATVCMVIGTILISFNIAARMIPPDRNPHAYRNPSAHETIFKLQHLKFANNHQFAQQVTILFYKGIKHYWSNQTTELKLPFWRNWSAAAAVLLIPPLGTPLKQLRNHLKQFMTYYEYTNYKDAIYRGVGLCSQHALAATDFVRKQGLKGYTLRLNGHVINETFFPNGEIKVIDADYGVVLPFSLDFAKTHPERVKAIYQTAHIDKSSIQALSQIYQHKHKPYINKNNLLFRQITALLNWTIPALLLLIGIGLLLHGHSRRRH